MTQYYDLTLMSNTSGYLFMMNFDVTLTRVLCAFLMHMLSEPEVRQAMRLFKYVLNHTKGRGKMLRLYKKTCGQEFPIPSNPKQVTYELLTEAFKKLKQWQYTEKINCRHSMPSEVDFLLGRIDKSYKSEQKLAEGKIKILTMKEKYEQLRKCKEKTLCRDEIYEMFVKIGENYPEKKADDLFFTANQDNDATISCDEFIQLVRKEIEDRNTKRYKFAQAIAKLKKSVKKARCSILVRWFSSDVKPSKGDKSED